MLNMFGFRVEAEKWVNTTRCSDTGSVLPFAILQGSKYLRWRYRKGFRARLGAWTQKASNNLKGTTANLAW